jgi:geranylgeranylglycerol-phosphate geranylgeranyltransferase
VGKRPALFVAVAFVGFAVVVSPAPYLLGTFGSTYLLVLAPTIAGLVAGMYRSFTDPTGGQSLLKASMFLAAIAFVIGRIAVVV